VALSEGLAPLQNWVKTLVDRVLAEELGAADLEFAWDQDKDADPAQTATIAADYVKAGIKSINEVRAELGLPPVAGGEQPKIQTAQGLVPLTQSAAPSAASAKAAKADTLRRYNDNHYGPGPQGGQFAPADEGNGSGMQVAQEEDPKEEEGDPSDPAGPVRAALYHAARSKLNAIDPENPELSPIVANPGWTPSNDDVGNMQGALDRAIENHAEAAASYAYDKHVDTQKEFPEVGSQVQLQLLAQDVMQNTHAEPIARGRVMFYQSKTNTLVIVNPDHPEEDNIFRPTRRGAYVDDLRRGE